MRDDNNLPLVSVIIPCYNQAQYLPDAIESVLNQTYRNIEIVVVNDGSTDGTEQTAASYKEVRYVHKVNKGLSAARNTGVENSNGEFLVFLDADDWLLPHAIEINCGYLQENPEAAFVSGGHDKVDNNKNILEQVAYEVNKDHYIHLLKGNYIGMHAAVMYRADVFKSFQFDESLKACEDYDLYLKIARFRPVIHHTAILAAYRKHSGGMSTNAEMMLNKVLKVLNRQLPDLKNSNERKALKEGRLIWKKYYGQIISGKYNMEATGAIKNSEEKGLKYFIKKHAPSSLYRMFLRLKYGYDFIPPVGKVNRGDMKSLNPFCSDFGYSRGGPIDRYYIETFLEKNKSIIKGRVLEIGDNSYTVQFGGSKVLRSDVLHVDETNSQATLIGDLSNGSFINDNIFDCIILTQTLHLIYDFRSAVDTCFRIMKPGGALLLTVPGITRIDQGEWKNSWYWSFTLVAVKKLLGEIFGNDKVEAENFGNVNVAASFLYGMGKSEIKKEILDFTDEYFPVIITAKCTKN